MSNSTSTELNRAIAKASKQASRSSDATAQQHVSQVELGAAQDRVNSLESVLTTQQLRLQDVEKQLANPPKIARAQESGGGGKRGGGTTTVMVVNQAEVDRLTKLKQDIESVVGTAQDEVTAAQEDAAVAQQNVTEVASISAEAQSAMSSMENSISSIKARLENSETAGSVTDLELQELIAQNDELVDLLPSNNDDIEEFWERVTHGLMDIDGLYRSQQHQESGFINDITRGSSHLPDKTFTSVAHAEEEFSIIIAEDYRMDLKELLDDEEELLNSGQDFADIQGQLEVLGEQQVKANQLDAFWQHEQDFWAREKLILRPTVIDDTLNEAYKEIITIENQIDLAIKNGDSVVDLFGDLADKKLELRSGDDSPDDSSLKPHEEFTNAEMMSLGLSYDIASIRNVNKQNSMAANNGDTEAQGFLDQGYAIQAGLVKLRAFANEQGEFWANEMKKPYSAEQQDQVQEHYRTIKGLEASYVNAIESGSDDTMEIRSNMTVAQLALADIRYAEIYEDYTIKPHKEEIFANLSHAAYQDNIDMLAVERDRLVNSNDSSSELELARNQAQSDAMHKALSFWQGETEFWNEQVARGPEEGRTQELDDLYGDIVELETQIDQLGYNPEDDDTRQGYISQLEAKKQQVASIHNGTGVAS